MSHDSRCSLEEERANDIIYRKQRDGYSHCFTDRDGRVVFVPEGREQRKDVNLCLAEARSMIVRSMARGYTY